MNDKKMYELYIDLMLSTSEDEYNAQLEHYAMAWYSMPLWKRIYHRIWWWWKYEVRSEVKF